jgi:hypothetical protein
LLDDCRDKIADGGCREAVEQVIEYAKELAEEPKEEGTLWWK